VALRRQIDSTFYPRKDSRGRKRKKERERRERRGGGRERERKGGREEERDEHRLSWMTILIQQIGTGKIHFCDSIKL